MPIYEYRCKKCNHVFEELQKMNEGNENLVCPACGEPRPEKLLSCCNSIGSGESSSFGSMPASPSCASRGFS
ncbi:MAG: zinc ribbon domain-containing protein [Pseudomonadota bacterium]